MNAVRDKMTMRAVLEENVASGRTPRNQPEGPSWVEVNTPVPCFAWTERRRHVEPTDKDARVEDFRALFPLKALVTEQYRIKRITDRRERVLFEGPIRIDSIQRKIDHLELNLRQVSS